MEKSYKFSRLAIWCLISLALWLVFILLPAFWPVLMNNATCFKYLGCNSGFFGYDAIQHFLFGVMASFCILWFCQKFPKYSILPNGKGWKTAIVLVACISLIALLWEIFECAHDFYFISILHDQLLSYRLHFNYLTQPSNMDTMGDLTVSLFGSITALLIRYFY